MRSHIYPSQTDPERLLVDDVTSHLAASISKDYGSPSSSSDGSSGSSSGLGDGSGKGEKKKGQIRVSLLHNPSHLEIVGAVAAGGWVRWGVYLYRV